MVFTAQDWSRRSWHHISLTYWTKDFRSQRSQAMKLMCVKSTPNTNLTDFSLQIRCGNRVTHGIGRSCLMNQFSCARWWTWAVGDPLQFLSLTFGFAAAASRSFAFLPVRMSRGNDHAKKLKWILNLRRKYCNNRPIPSFLPSFVFCS